MTKKNGAGSKGFSWQDMHKPYTLELILSAYYSGCTILVCFLMQNWLFGAYCGAMAVLFIGLSFGDCVL